MYDSEINNRAIQTIPLDDGHGIDTKITKNINTIVWKYADIVEKEIKIEKET